MPRHPQHICQHRQASRRRRRLPRGLLCGLPLALLPHLSAAADATVAPAIVAQLGGARHYDIPAGPLGEALAEFSRTTGVPLRAPDALAQIRSPGLQGRHEPAEALRRLLAGTGVSAVRQTDGNWLLQAGAPASAEPGVPELRSIEVLGTHPRDAAFQAPLSTSVLTHDDIERFRGTSVGDIFSGVPGVLVGENRNSGGLDINIRGMQGQGRVPILIDGARQETTVGRGYSGVISRTYIDPDLIGGVTVEKGPVSGAGGTGATGGLVSLRTLTIADVLRDGREFGVRLRGQAIGNNNGSAVPAGTYAGLFLHRPDTYPSGRRPMYRINCIIDSLCQGEEGLPDAFGFPENLNRSPTFKPRSYARSVALGWRLSRLDIVAAYAQRSQGNYYAGAHGPTPVIDYSNQLKLPFWTIVYPEIKGPSRYQANERIPGTDYSSKSGLLKTTLHLPADQEWELSYMRYSSRYSEIQPGTLNNFVNFRPIGFTEPSEVVAHTYTSRYRWQPDHHAIDLRVNLWRTTTSTLNNGTQFPELAHLEPPRERAYRWRTGLDASNTSRFGLNRWGELEWRYGGSTQWERADSEFIAPPRYAYYQVSGRQGRRTEYSLFTGVQYQPVPSLTLDASMRYSHYRSKDDKPFYITNPNNPFCINPNADGVCEPLENTQRASGRSPILSLRWEPWQGIQLYGRYATAHRLPSLFESTDGFSVSATPDIPLRPERTRNKEAGLNLLLPQLLSPHDTLRLKLAYFRNDTTDYITRTIKNLWEQGRTTENYPWTWTLRNIESVRHQGWELSGGYDLGVAYLDFGATKYNVTEICHTGSWRVFRCNNYGIAASYINNAIPPRWHASATLGLRLLERRLTVGVRGTFVGQRNPPPKYNDDTLNALLLVVPWPPYRVFDLFASFRINDRLSMDFNLDNATDRYYLDALGFGLTPAPGRTARLGLTLQF